MGQGGDREGRGQPHGLLEQQTHDGRVTTSGGLDQHGGVVLCGGGTKEGWNHLDHLFIKYTMTSTTQDFINVCSTAKQKRRVTYVDSRFIPGPTFRQQEGSAPCAIRYCTMPRWPPAQARDSTVWSRDVVQRFTSAPAMSEVVGGDKGWGATKQYSMAVRCEYRVCEKCVVCVWN